MSAPIEAYESVAPAYEPYDPHAAAVAQLLVDAIAEHDPRLTVEHVGSTAVPGCDGKGYIDLLVTYPAGALEDAKQALQRLGFQPQRSRIPFPEERPMRVGSVRHRGRRYLIHAHVVSGSAPEAAQLRFFRDQLRADPALARAYEREKQQIVADGVLDSKDYALRKGAFIEQVLGRAANSEPGSADERV